jgi:hypothetical protein
MSDQDDDFDDELTLDPPGRIAVIGAGPMGLECALYGRFLGYDVVVIEAHAIGGSLNPVSDQPLPMMPDRCLSPLALGAIDAQLETVIPRTLPLTVEEWIRDGLALIASSDLLADRIMLPVRCESIQLVPVELDDEDREELDGEVPPDLELTLRNETGSVFTEKFECVILATGRTHSIELGFPESSPYFFSLGRDFNGDVEQDLRRGWREIVAIFASLMGRADLDLYRPRRV